MLETRRLFPVPELPLEHLDLLGPGLGARDRDPVPRGADLAQHLPRLALRVKLSDDVVQPPGAGLLPVLRPAEARWGPREAAGVCQGPRGARQGSRGAREAP